MRAVEHERRVRRRRVARRRGRFGRSQYSAENGRRGNGGSTPAATTGRDVCSVHAQITRD